jgi:hypothetical protein
MCATKRQPLRRGSTARCSPPSTRPASSPTTADGLSLFRAPHRLLYDLTRHLTPGGLLFPALAGPIPAALLPAGQLHNFNPPPAPLQNLPQLPQGVGV